MDKKKIIDEWISNNGAANFDLKHQNIILYDGGLFSIGKKPIRLSKIIGKKQMPNGMTMLIFSKNKPIKDFQYYATLGFEELRETILHLQRMEKILKSLGYKTNH